MEKAKLSQISEEEASNIKDLGDIFDKKKKNRKVSNIPKHYIPADKGFKVKLKCYGYVRVSTEYQVEGGYSLEAQEIKIKDYAKKNDYEFMCIYSDKGISGKYAEDRDELKNLMSILKATDVVIVTNISRLSRNLIQMRQIIEYFMKNHIKLVSLDQNIDLDTASGQVMFNIMATFADGESKFISERVSSTMAVLSEKGLLRHKPSFGFMIQEDPITKVRSVVENPEEQRTVEFIREIVSKNPNINITAICKILDAEGYKFRKSYKAHWATIDRITTEFKIPVNKKSPKTALLNTVKSQDSQDPK